MALVAPPGPVCQLKPTAEQGTVPRCTAYSGPSLQTEGSN